jgi:hypothetical protein
LRKLFDGRVYCRVNVITRAPNCQALQQTLYCPFSSYSLI